MMPNEEILEIKRRLEELERRTQKLEKMVGHGKDEGHKISNSKQEIAKLAQKIKVSEYDIERLFDLEEDSLTLVNVIGKDDREKTQNVALLILLGYKYFFSKDELLSQEIRRNVAENRIPLSNFSTYLNEIIPSLIRRKGIPKSPNTAYKLTILGESQAKELLRNIVSSK